MRVSRLQTAGSSVHCKAFGRAVTGGTVHYITLHYTIVQYSTLHYTIVQYSTLHYTTVHYSTLVGTVAARSMVVQSVHAGPPQPFIQLIRILTFSKLNIARVRRSSV